MALSGEIRLGDWLYNSYSRSSMVEFIYLGNFRLILNGYNRMCKKEKIFCNEIGEYTKDRNWEVECNLKLISILYS